MFAKRHLTAEEINTIVGKIPTPRDKALFLLGVSTGFRISELLSLTVADVATDGKLKDHLTVEAKKMKGGKKCRTVILGNTAKQALASLLHLEPNTPLFPITKQHFWRVLKSACKVGGIDPTLVGTHSMRKTFAQRVYKGLGNDIYATSKALGHANIATTVAYLGVEQEKIDEVVAGF